MKYYLEDSFEKITLYSNKVKNATYKKIADDKYEVTINVESTKNYFDGNGKLLDTGIQPNLLEIAIFDDDVKNEQGMTIKSPLVLEQSLGKTWKIYILSLLRINCHLKQELIRIIK